MPIQSQLTYPPHRQTAISGQAISQTNASQTTQFGNTALAAEAVAKVGKEQLADKLFGVFNRGLFAKEVKLMNMSIEDWATRLNLLLGVYLPQGYLSLKENKHKWETNGRNLTIWTSTILLTLLVKHDKIGVNSLFDKFMRPRLMQPQLDDIKIRGPKSLFTKLINPIKLPYNYYELLEIAGVQVSEGDYKKAYWSSLQKNANDSLERIFKGLKTDDPAVLAEFQETILKLHNRPTAEQNKALNGLKDAKKGIQKAMGESGELLSGKVDDALQEFQGAIKKKALSESATAELVNAAKEKFLGTYPKLRNRMAGFRLLSTATFTAATVYFIGVVMMRFVLKFIAPNDHDFDMGKLKGKDKEPLKPIQTSFNNPNAFAWLQQQQALMSSKTNGGQH